MKVWLFSAVFFTGLWTGLAAGQPPSEGNEDQAATIETQGVRLPPTSNRDLIMLIAMKTDKLTKADVNTQIRDALLGTRNEKCDIQITPVPRRVYERFSRIMHRAAVGQSRQPIADDTISEVADQSAHWHIRKDPTPQSVVLQVGDGNGSETTKEVTLPVAPVTSKELSTAQAVASNVVLIRANEEWDILGYRLVWEKKSEPATGFAKWPRQLPTYVVALRNFNGSSDELFTKLNSNDVSEKLVASAPARSLKLVSIDMDPPVIPVGSQAFENNFTLSVPSLKPSYPDRDRQAWVLFPLTAGEKDAELAKLKKFDEDEKQSGAESLPAFIMSSGGGTEYVPLAESVKSVPNLPEGMPQPTALLDSQLKPKWYAVPAIAERDQVARYARTFQVGPSASYSSEEDRDRRWMIVIYGRDITAGKPEPVWRARQSAEIQQKAGTKYSTSIETAPFLGFYRGIVEQNAAPPGATEHK